MEGFEKPRIKSLLEHFSEVEDFRESWRVAYPLPEVLLVLVCATMASCDDFEDIAEWGKAHVPFLRRFLPYRYGVPCARWINILMNRMDAELFSACFMAWARSLRPDLPEQIALDGKTSRRSGDSSHAALHLVSAFATHERLVLGQEATEAKSNEITAIPTLLAKLAQSGALAGTLVSIDAMGCNPRVTQSVLDQKADYLVTVKANQPELLGDLEAFFKEPPSVLEIHAAAPEKAHGRIETRTAKVSTDTAWLQDRSIPGITMIGCIDCETEKASGVTRERRFYISSRAMSAQQLLDGVRSHWMIENALHWVLDVTFKDDLSRVRKGFGAKNMAVVRHFAINLVRNAPIKNSIKTRRKIASWDTDFLSSLLVNPDS
jgi:predicted transposase YbfD/YdcC